MGANKCKKNNDPQLCDNAEHLRKVLGKPREHKLLAKASKCEMLKTSVEFLGQQISRGGMTPTKAKMKAVLDWATPEDVKGVGPSWDLQITTDSSYRTLQQ